MSRVYTGVMTENAPELLHVHDRSPVLLDPEHWDTWLSAPLDDVRHLDQPLAAAHVRVEVTVDPWWKPKGS